MKRPYASDQEDCDLSRRDSASQLTGHLTDEQFADLLAGVSPDTVVEAHLHRCAPCREEVEAILGSVGEFNALSLGWAEREAPRRVPPLSRWAVRLGGRPVWNVGLAAAAAVMAVAIGMHLPQHGAGTLSGATSSARAGLQGRGTMPIADSSDSPTGAELATDNRLLASIDQELSTIQRPAFPVSVLKTSSSHAVSHGPEALEN